MTDDTIALPPLPAEWDEWATLRAHKHATERNLSSHAEARVRVAIIDGMREAVRLYIAGRVGARFLFIAMDDDGNGHPEYCANEHAVFEAVGRSMYVNFNVGTIDQDDFDIVQANAEELIENGSVTFEGDPGLALYKLPSAALTTPPDAQGDER